MLFVVTITIAMEEQDPIPLWITDPLPENKRQRARLIAKDSIGFTRRLSPTDISKLLYNLSKTKGLSLSDIERKAEAERKAEGWGIDRRWWPEYRRD